MIDIFLEKVRGSEQIDRVGSWSMSVKVMVPPNPKFIGGTQLEIWAHLSSLRLEIRGSIITYKEAHLLNYLNSGSILFLSAKLALPSGHRVGINSALRCWAVRLKLAMVSPVI